jgi:heat shock protein HslJ
MGKVMLNISSKWIPSLGATISLFMLMGMHWILPACTHSTAAPRSSIAASHTTKGPGHENSVWILQTWEHQAEQVPLPGAEISLRIDADRISGSGLCNSFGAVYAEDDGYVAISQLQTTQRACIDPSDNALEARLWDALSATYRILLDESGHLIFMYGEKSSPKGRLIFRPRDTLPARK